MLLISDDLEKSVFGITQNMLSFLKHFCLIEKQHKRLFNRLFSYREIVEYNALFNKNENTFLRIGILHSK